MRESERHYELQNVMVKLLSYMACRRLKEWWHSFAHFKLGTRWSLLDIFMLWTIYLHENVGPFLLNGASNSVVVKALRY